MSKLREETEMKKTETKKTETKKSNQRSANDGMGHGREMEPS